MDASALAQTARLLAAQAALTDDLVLRPGAEIVARVAEAPREGGGGLLALAGALVRAQLPPGLAEGAKIRLTVVGEENGALVLRIKPAEAPAGGDETVGRLAAALATKGDGDLLRIALDLVGSPGALALPEGRAVEVRVDEDGTAEGGREEAAGEAAFVLHLPTLGAVEVRLRLVPGAVTAAVVTEPGEAAAKAEAGAAELAERLVRATGRPAAVDVAARTPDMARPRRPAVVEGFDAYA